MVGGKANPLAAEVNRPGSFLLPLTHGRIVRYFGKTEGVVTGYTAGKATVVRLALFLPGVGLAIGKHKVVPAGRKAVGSTIGCNMLLYR